MERLILPPFFLFRNEKGTSNFTFTDQILQVIVARMLRINP